MIEVPLFNRFGKIVDFAFVDEDDHALVSIYRWHLGTSGYAYTHILHPLGGIRPGRKTSPRYTKLGMHRFICGLEFGDKREPDHINLNKLDNRRENLRIGTRSQNCQNLPLYGGSSRYRGVTWDKDAKRWRVRVRLNGKLHHVGTFTDEDEAGRAATAWRSQNMEFSNG